MTSPDAAIVTALARLRDAGPPLNLAQLNQRVADIAAALMVPESRVRQLLGAAIIAQLLPSGTSIKGGMGLKMRLGERGTRATRDLDVAAADQAKVAALLAERLAKGWGSVPALRRELQKDPAAPNRPAFIGKVHDQRKATPTGVPPEYVLTPYRVSLSFLSAKYPFVSVPSEIGVDEFNCSQLAPGHDSVAPQIVAACEALGCGTPGPVTLISWEQQIAQKIHAVTDPTQLRGHDLVDLQLLWHEAQDDPSFDITVLHQLCQRTFEFRAPSRVKAGKHPHPWPPLVADLTHLALGYETAREEVTATSATSDDLLTKDIDTAAHWLADIIETIRTSPSDPAPGRKGRP